MQSHYKVLILGGGTGGIAVAARLSRKLAPQSVGIVDPAQTHFYQPLWTLSGAGVISKEHSARPLSKMIPSGVHWVQEPVSSIQPLEKRVILKNQTVLTYDYLIVALGLRLAWEKVPGAQEALGKKGVCTIYEYDQVDKTCDFLRQFKGGTAIFTMPPVPIKCAGAPQKIMYLADEIFRRNGVRDKSQIYFATAGQAIFGIPTFAQALNQVAKRKDIQLWFQHQLVRVDAENQQATFAITDPQGNISEKNIRFDLLHVVPPMTAPQVISQSELAEPGGNQKDWLAVDQFTLQHKRFPEVFGLGDVTGIPNSKTGAAIRKQAPVVVSNLLAQMEGRPLSARYDGYSSCPLVTQVGRVILAEFGYDGKLLPSFPVNPAKERWSMWILKRYLLPPMYWWAMMKGRA
ncbi:NAD(P)/FAD-dependent oxidoreductase [bacterium]|nr:NAD(P)/FAD-dependent oxidoreductase [bacterium]